MVAEAVARADTIPRLGLDEQLAGSFQLPTGKHFFIAAKSARNNGLAKALRQPKAML